jgi:hypothetical protein
VPDIYAKAGLLSPAEEAVIIQCITLNSQKAKHTTRSPILSYATKTFKKLYHGGYRPGKDFLIEHNAKSYVDRLLFENFIRHQLIPHITALQTNPCYLEAEAVLLMANCSAHVTPEIFRLLGEKHIKIGIFAPYTINIFQALDLSFLGVFKTKEKFWMDQGDLYRDDTQISPPIPFGRDARKHSWELCQGQVFV